MTGTKLYQIREWLAGDSSHSHPLTIVLIQMINEDIKEKITSFDIPPEFGMVEKTFAECIKGNKKVAVIKAVRRLFGTGLKEAKDISDANWERWTKQLSPEAIPE